MNKLNNNNTDKTTIFSGIAIVLLMFIFLYIAYLMFNKNNILNNNELSTNINNIINDSKNNVNIKLNNENIVAKKEIVYEEKELSSYTSTLYDNEESRIFNINKACEILNGTTVNSGDEFSFNNTIGPMSEANGFKKATGFDSDGKLLKVPGGGMCQISSTLYNAVLLGNLEVTERHPHSRRVNYVPVDKDATIYYPTLDFKFKNNTENTLKIYASTNNYSVTIKIIKIEQSN